MKKQKQIVKDGYNAIPDTYLSARTKGSEDVRLLDDLIKRLPKDALILDAGCGSGIPVAQILAEQFQVVGVDFAEAQIELARKLVPKAKFVCGDICELKFDNDSFDAICSYYAIIHIPRTEH